MKAYTGSVYVNDFNMFNRVYRVYIQAEAPYRMHKDDINLFFVRASSGEMVPLTALGDAEYTTGPGNIRRFNMFNTAVIRGAAASGYSSGEAMRVVENIAEEHLSDNIGVEWSGLSYQEKKAEGQMGIIMLLVFVFVFLFLAALYESWLVPIAVLLSLPMGVWLGERCVFSDRVGDFSRVGCKECNLNRRICTGRNGEGSRCVKGCSYSCQFAFPADFDDFFSFCLRYVTFGYGLRSGVR